MISSSDDSQQRVARLTRLRRLGLRRGVGDLAPAEPTHRANREESATGQPGASTLSDEAGRARATENATQLPGEEAHTPFGPAWVRTERYPLAEHPELTHWLRVQPTTVVALERNERLADMTPATVAFLDTETTGLSLGTGTYTFMIGIGTYERPAAAEAAFVVRQFFMRNPAEERAQLHLVEEALSHCSGIVSFNGRGFDMPLIGNRFVLAGMPPPLAGAPHLDLLPPARRLWRARWRSCSLGNLERNVLGLARATDDVPGYLIPDIYRQYYRAGAVTDLLVRVFYHNLRDILTLPLLAAHMARFFQADEAVSALPDLHPLECFSLGRCYEALRWDAASVAAYRAALTGPLAPAERGQVLRDLSFLHKRLQQRELAAELWEEWVSTAAGDDLTPYVELAKHHEWYTGDLRAARGWAAWALHVAEKACAGYQRDLTLADLRHRLARLECKLTGIGAEPAGPEE